MAEALSMKVDWKAWNAKLKKMKTLPKHMMIMTKSLTIFGVERLKQSTPRSKEGGRHLADAWEYKIKGTNPVYIEIMNALEQKEDILGYLERGTEPHPITPRAKTWMKFLWRGKIVFAKHVEHPGTQPYAMIATTRADLIARYNSLRNTILKRFCREVEGAR